MTPEERVAHLSDQIEIALRPKVGVTNVTPQTIEDAITTIKDCVLKMVPQLVMEDLDGIRALKPGEHNPDRPDERASDDPGILTLYLPPHLSWLERAIFEASARIGPTH